MDEPLDKFGEFFVSNLRDKMLDDLQMLLTASWKAPSAQKLQDRLATLNDEQRDILRETAEHLITAGMHDFLFALEEDADSGGSIRIMVDGTDLAEASDGLHGEIFTENGWISRFSKYKQNAKG